MERLRGLSLRWKLFGGFGAVLVLTVAVGVVMLSGAGSMNSYSETVNQSDVPSVLVIDDILASVNDFQASVAQNMLYSGAAGQAQVQSADADAAEIGRDLRKYASLAGPGADTRDYDRVKTMWAATQRAFAPLLHVDAGQDPKLVALFTKVGNGLIGPLQNAIGPWRAVNVSDETHDTALTSQAYSSDRLDGIVLIGLASLLGRVGPRRRRIRSCSR